MEAELAPPQTRNLLLFRPIFRSLALAITLTLLGAVVQHELSIHDISGIAEYFDDALVGALAGVMVFAYERRQLKDLKQKLVTIRAMNHHIRNSLQAISYAPHTEPAEQVELIREAVDRITWALTDILPGDEQQSIELTLYAGNRSRNGLSPRDRE